MDHTTRSLFADWISIFAGLMTIVGIPGLAIWSFKNRLQRLSALRVYRVLLITLKIGLIVLFLGFMLLPFHFSYSSLVVMTKDSIQSDTYYWDADHILAHVFSYLVSVFVIGSLSAIGSACIYTGSFRPFRVMKENWNKVQITFESSGYESAEIIDARYGAKTTFIDVKRTLNEIMTKEKLEFTVGNDLFSDPIKGVAKKLHLKIKVGSKIYEQDHKEGKTVKFSFDSENHSNDSS